MNQKQPLTTPQLRVAAAVVLMGCIAQNGDRTVLAIATTTNTNLQLLIAEVHVASYVCIRVKQVYLHGGAEITKPSP